MHYSATGLAWVQDAYTLVFGGLLLLGARAGDLLGRRRVFISGGAGGRTDPSAGLIGSGGGFCHYLEDRSLPDRGQSGLPEESGDEPPSHDDERRK
jgi:MFS family permease